MKVGIYTALYGGYDTIKTLPDGLRGTMFHDRRGLAHVEQLPDHLDFLRDAEWEFRYVPHNIVTRHGDPALVAPMLAHKYWKTHPAVALPDVDVSIWIDASITLHPGFMEMAVEALGDDDWAAVPHPWRNCIFDEAFYSATLPRYTSLAGAIRDQAAWYRHLGHPPRWGLPATGVCIRRHTPEVLELSEHWWYECLNRSHQDQISLPVLVRLAQEKVKFNYELGWEKLWSLTPHLK